MRVIVTGATSFIGRLLQKNCWQAATMRICCKADSPGLPCSLRDAWCRKWRENQAEKGNASPSALALEGYQEVFKSCPVLVPSSA